MLKEYDAYEYADKKKRQMVGSWFKFGLLHSKTETTSTLNYNEFNNQYIKITCVV